MNAKTAIIETRLSNTFKRDMVAVATRALMLREPELSKKQVQKIFNFGYRMFWEKRDEGIYDRARQEVRRTEGPLGPFAARTDKGGRKGHDKSPKEVRPKQLAKGRGRGK